MAVKRPPNGQWWHKAPALCIRAQLGRPSYARMDKPEAYPTKACPSCTLRFARDGHFDPADGFGIAKAATVAVGRNNLHASTPDLLHYSQRALPRAVQPFLGRQQAIHPLIVAPAGVFDTAF